MAMIDQHANQAPLTGRQNSAELRGSLGQEMLAVSGAIVGDMPVLGLAAGEIARTAPARLASLTEAELKRLPPDPGAVLLHALEIIEHHAA
jgi:hypothetical protein